MRLLFFFIFSLSTIGVFAQGSIELTLKDENQHPIEFANFRLFTATDSSVVKGEYSDENGKIVMTDIPFGNYYASITFFGYEDYLIDKIEITKNQRKINFHNLSLKPEKSQQLDEVVVRGKEKKLVETSIDKRSYNVEEDMTAIGGSLTDVLSNVPSVDVDNDGNISLRGNSGVTILIDGRPSAMASGEDGALDGIPASAVERIEVVTNPSAKYNPEGTAGIINIVLKKQKLRGFNLNVQGTAATEDLYGGSLNFNFRREKFNLFASYSFDYRSSTSASYNDRMTQHSGDTLERLFQDNIGTRLGKSHTGKIGTDFFLTDRQTMGISVSGRYSNHMRDGIQRSEQSYNDDLFEYWSNVSNTPRLRKSIDFNANYKLDFKDEKGNLMIDITESLGAFGSESEFDEYHYYPDGTPTADNYLYENQRQNGINDNFMFQADLMRTINEKMSYDAGIDIQLRHQRRDNNLRYYDIGEDDIVPDNDENNDFDYRENIFAGYGIFKHAVTDRFKYQAGVRLEQALTTPHLITTNEIFKKDYFSFFPSAHLTYGDDDMGQFYASYSRRINRPNMWQLNPFARRTDPLNIRTGNPDINPEYINSYEIGYEKGWDNVNFMASLYFKETVDKIQRVKQFRDDGVGVTSFENIDKSYDYGIEIIGQYSPFSWWKNVISANAYESRMNANFNGTELSNKGISWDVKLNSTFTFLDNTTAIQVNAQYVAPRYTVQGIFQFNPGIDIGVTRKLLDNKMTLGLRVSDVFDQKSFYMEVDDRGTKQVSEFEWTSRRLILTLSYKFGNLKTKDENRRGEMPNGAPPMDDEM